MSPATPGSTQGSFLPLFCSAAGMLIGGVILASIGPMTGNEFATTILAAVGMIVGSISGGYIGSRWLGARQSQAASTEPPSAMDGGEPES